MYKESRDINDGVELADNKTVFDYMQMGEILQQFQLGLIINTNEPKLKEPSMDNNTLCFQLDQLLFVPDHCPSA